MGPLRARREVSVFSARLGRTHGRQTQDLADGVRPVAESWAVPVIRLLILARHLLLPLMDHLVEEHIVREAHAALLKFPFGTDARMCPT